MFSIIIPVFNYDCTELVRELIRCCSLTTVDYEIIIGNDCSSDAQVIEALKAMDKQPNCRVINEERNIGKAYMLFHLAEKAVYPYLILIDSDARVCRDDFIENYLKAAIGHDVVCGGLVMSRKSLRKDNKLRYLYEENAAGIRRLDYRQKHPHKNLSTFNLLIKRSVFLATPFHKQCYQYGYEDTVLGIDLQRMGVGIQHIDNPLVHEGIDSNVSFLTKTRKALQVLVGLDRYYQERIRISATALKMQRWRILWIASLWHKIFGRAEEYMLMKCPSLFVFNVYKLGYFACLQRRNAQKKSGCTSGCDETPNIERI